MKRNFLVLGATSELFSFLLPLLNKEDALFLVGRDVIKLEILKNKIKLFGFIHATIIQSNLTHGFLSVLDVIQAVKIDVLINIASSTSGYRDVDIGHNALQDHLRSDLYHPIELINLLLKKNESLHICYISSFLTKVKSFDREIYSFIKRLNEIYLERLKCYPGVTVQIISISTFIPKDNGFLMLPKIASVIIDGLVRKQSFRVDRIGISGKFLIGIYYFSPILYSLVNRMQRGIRALRRQT